MKDKPCCTLDFDVIYWARGEKLEITVDGQGPFPANMTAVAQSLNNYRFVRQILERDAPPCPKCGGEVRFVLVPETGIEFSCKECPWLSLDSEEKPNEEKQDYDNAETRSVSEEGEDKST